LKKLPRQRFRKEAIAGQACVFAILTGRVNNSAGLENRKARKKIFLLTICRIPVRPFDYIVKAGQPARPKTKK
jgi:hypothetical protein